MSTGKVKWFSAKKGFGFITDDETKEDIFIHYQQIVSEGFRTLENDQKVSYDKETDPRNPQKLRATNVIAL